MKRGKSKISIMLVLALSVMLAMQNFAFASTLRDKIEIEVRKQYENDSQFLLEKQDKGSAWAEENINKIIERRVKKASGMSTRSTPDAVKSVSIRDIQQTTEYNCGPTNALNILYTAGRASQVTGSTDAAKIATLSGSSYCDTNNNGSIVYKVKNTLNNFMPSNKKNYVYTKILDKLTLTNGIYESLNQGYAAIMHADTSQLPYWDGYETGHYISIYHINTDSNIIKVTDSYNGQLCTGSPYLNTFGKHNVTLTDAYNATYKRYLIHYE